MFDEVLDVGAQPLPTGFGGRPPLVKARDECQFEIDVGPFKDVESLELFLGQLQPSLLLPRE